MKNYEPIFLSALALLTFLCTTNGVIKRFNLQAMAENRLLTLTSPSLSGAGKSQQQQHNLYNIQWLSIQVQATLDVA